jgi:hypothetical protein
MLRLLYYILIFCRHIPHSLINFSLTTRTNLISVCGLSGTPKSGQAVKWKCRICRVKSPCNYQKGYIKLNQVLAIWNEVRHLVPDKPQTLIRFVRVVREKLIRECGPVVVHCRYVHTHASIRWVKYLLRDHNYGPCVIWLCRICRVKSPCNYQKGYIKLNQVLAIWNEVRHLLTFYKMSKIFTQRSQLWSMCNLTVYIFY